MAKRALVLSGGGVKGAYQVGALKKWLLEDNLDYEILTGVSVGALNVAFLSQAKLGEISDAYAKLLKLWNTVDDGKVFKKWKPFGYIESLWQDSVLNSDPLLAWLKRDLDEALIAGSGREVRVGATSWDTGEYRLASQSDVDFHRWVAASASFPIFLSPVKIDGQKWTDGGIRNVTPLAEAIRLGAEEIDVIMCSNPDLPTDWDPKKKHAVPDYVLRAFDLMSDQIMRADLKICGAKNEIAERSGSYKQIKLRLLQPDVKLVEDSLSFDRLAIQKMIVKGYEDACRLAT